MTQPNPRIEPVMREIRKHIVGGEMVPSDEATCCAPLILAAADVVDPARLALAQLATAAQHPYKGPNDTDASMLTAAAHRLDGGFEVGGQHTRATVGRVLRAVAAILDAAEGAR